MKYFLNSAKNISYFLEEKAVQDGKLIITDKSKIINKIGHALHDVNPIFNAFTRQQKLKDLTDELGVTNPLIVQSMYIFKQPGIGGIVVPHQDSTFIHTEPLSTVGFWAALEDATKNNGCLWMLPGSHTNGIKRRFLRTEDGKSTYFKPPLVKEQDWPDHSNFIPVEVKKGSLVVIHGSVVHLSYENKSTDSRHAYSWHIVDGTKNYSKDNWLLRDDFKGY